MTIAIARDPIYRRRAPMLAIKSFATPAVTLAGIELAHRITRLDPATMTTICRRAALSTSIE